MKKPEHEAVVMVNRGPVKPPYGTPEREAYDLAHGVSALPESFYDGLPVPAEDDEGGYEEIDRPHHYSIKLGGNTYDVIDLIDALGLNFHLGNALKYLVRAGRKPGVDAVSDLRKAAYYLNRLADKLDDNPF